MHVSRLELVDFRSYPRAEVDFEPGVSVLVGPNGVGKTNLVEALGYLATLSSHRVATDAPLVRAGADSAVIRAQVQHEGRSLLVELAIEPGRANRARLAGAPARRPRDILGALRMVLFAPEDLSLVRGDPAERRRYLDELLVARQPRFAGVRADYERTLKQRNALLRTAYLARKTGAGARDLSTLDVWDTHLAQHGAELLAARLDLCSALGPHVAKAYDAVACDDDPASAPSGVAADRFVVAGRGGASLTYRAGVPATTTDRAELEQALREALRAARTQEVERGVTLVGPHRDDLLLTLGDLPAKGYASHGESWSYALALRLAAFELLRDEGIEPVLVLDDVFAELDTGRRERLAALVAGASQLLVTCAVDADVPASLGGAHFRVGTGEVSRVR